VQITYDPAKRAKTLAERRLDFDDAAEVFNGLTWTDLDERWDYGEIRNITAGFLRGKMVVLVWTLRGEKRHIISMRYCHDREQERWRKKGID
jgi:uncharacterized DUF497 family protein